MKKKHASTSYLMPFKKFLRVSGLCALTISITSTGANELYPGGKATTKQTGSNAYSMPSANMSLSRRLDFSVGNSFFRNPWVIAPASTDARDGLGPLFNANSCQSCHIKDGRGHPPEGPDDSALSMILRLQVASINSSDFTKQDSSRSNFPDPRYGGQLQDRSIPGVKAEGQVVFNWQYKQAVLPDGSAYHLRYPKVHITNLAYGDIHQHTLVSARIAPPMIGLGLLQAISEEDILSKQDPNDKNGDGISGKANMVWDVRAQEFSLGRFGWKAGQPNIAQQSAAAFRNDLGLTSRLFPDEVCQNEQVACLAAPTGRYKDEFEVSDKILDFVTFYASNLAVPARRLEHSREVIAGKHLFEEVGCTQCHTPSYVTGTVPQAPELSQQEIWPYTDMLLHDLGEGLADNSREFLAEGREWRTPPLWGLSSLKDVNGHTQLMHDGRARNVTEAILWHDGEAAHVKRAFMTLDSSKRKALTRFVESL